MAPRKSTTRSRHGKARTGSGPNYKFWILRGLVIFICIGSGYLLFLDHNIRSQFTGRKWSLPARVYASPLELYYGQHLTLKQFQAVLTRLGYKRNDSLSGAGEYRVYGNSIEFIERAFVIWDVREPEQRIRVDFSGNIIAAITNVSTLNPVDIVRIEPELIGKIYPEHNEDRILVSYENIPPFLVDALIAVEDRNFFHHGGIDLTGILRAFFVNLRSGKLEQGGSTITQQLVKNFFLTQEKTFWRKFNESCMAVLLERRYSKQEILSTYINEVYMGQYGARAIHGFGIAAEYYYGRPLNELRDDQIALLAGLVKGASYYNPRRHPARALERRNLVLTLMHKQGMLENSRVEILTAQELDLAESPSWSSAKYPAFLDLVKRQLLRDYNMSDLQNEGLKIFTTLEPIIQESARISAGDKLSKLEAQVRDSQGVLQIASVIVRSGTGEILAMLGGATEQPGSFNRALDARRPIGSLIKPAIYLTALSRPEKYNLLSRLEDAPVELVQEDGSIWKPDNYDHIHHGQVSLLEALKNSYNLASVRLGLELGLDNIISTLRKMGIQSEIKAYPSLLLGSLELSPVEVSQIFQILANGGFMIPVNSIREVLDNDNRPLQRYGLEVEQKLEPAAVFLLNFILSEVTRSGTAKSLQKTMAGIQLAGKTGTTNDMRDSWFAGFGDDLMAVVWLGYDDNRPTKFSGASGALQIWSAIMRPMNIKQLSLIPPENIMWTRLQNGIGGRACLGPEKVPYSGDYKPVELDSCLE